MSNLDALNAALLLGARLKQVPVGSKVLIINETWDKFVMIVLEELTLTTSNGVCWVLQTLDEYNVTPGLATSWVWSDDIYQVVELPPNFSGSPMSLLLTP